MQSYDDDPLVDVDLLVDVDPLVDDDPLALPNSLIGVAETHDWAIRRDCSTGSDVPMLSLTTLRGGWESKLELIALKFLYFLKM